MALTSKNIARQNITSYLDSLDSKGHHACFELGVRVNSVASGLLLDDLKEISRARHFPQAFMIPKVDSPEDLAVIWDYFKTTYGEERVQNSRTRLVIWIESARALLDMARILSTALDMHKDTGFFKLDAVVFGSDDYCADIGATRSNTGQELMFARQKFITCCKAFNLQAIDAVYIDIHDLEGLRKQSVEGKLWGFDGKQSIHPAQIPVIQESFLPPKEKIQWATELIDEYIRHEKNGKGAFTFRGSMIDRPLLLQAMNIVQTVKFLEGKHPKL